jgi:alkanesulfonate monooxygenase SsuD/methylene tetrahydromethanopterin reductase-like flavin-dependent oxidoreductase (luciferase family)
MEFAIQVGEGQVRRDETGIETLIEETLLAESLGFGVVCVPDHYVFEQMGRLRLETPAYDLFFVLATLAQRTRTIRLCSHVACMLFRHPATTARLFAQIDEASGGRVIAGVGAGWTRAEFTMMGIPYPDVSERLRIMDEAVTVMRGLWGADPFSFSGDYFQVRDAICRPRPTQQPGPPLMLGGSGSGILRRAGAWADIIHMIPVIGAAGTVTSAALQAFSDATIAGKLARVHAAASAAGRDPRAIRFASTIFTFTPTDSPGATRALAERLAAAYGLPAEEIPRHPIALIGTPEEMITELRLAINFSSAEQVKRFGTEVLPHV